jgi:hypothetical protein
MVVVLASSTALAQPRRQPRGGGAAAGGAAQPSAEARQRARDAYAAGQTQFRAGQYTEALVSFETAYREVPNPVVLLGVAECHERMNNWAQAVTTLERYLAERTDAPDRAAVEARITAARARPAILVVSSTPVGAAIAVDGNPTGRTTPAEVEVPPGDHTVILSLEGHDDASSSVTATFGTRHEVTGTLTARPTEPAQLGSEDDIFGNDGQGTGGDGGEPVDEGDGPSYTAAKIFAGIGGAALVAGTVLGFLALSEQGDFDKMPNEETADRGERLALFADVAFGVAAASLITGIILYLTEDGGDAPAEEAPAGDDAGGDGEATGQRVAPRWF